MSNTSNPALPHAVRPPAGWGSPQLARAIVLGLGLLVLCRNVTGPYVSLHEWNSAMYSVFARNHVAYGLGYTKLFCTWGDAAQPPAQPQRYLNHPPLIAAWAAVPMVFFGDHEWAARSVPILATLGSIWLLMLIVGRLYSSWLGVLAGFFYALLPVTAFFGRMLDHVPPVQFFSLLMLHGYLHRMQLYGADSRPGRGFWYYTLGAVLGIGTGWAALIMAGLIWLWHVARCLARRAPAMPLLWLTVIPAAALAAVVLHILWGCGWDWRMFGPLFYSRTVGPQQGLELGPWTAWPRQLAIHMWHNLTPFGIGAAVVYLALFPLTWGQHPVRRPASAAARPGAGADAGGLPALVWGHTTAVPVFLILLHGVLYVVGFKNQSTIHDYWQFFATPFVGVALATVVLGAVTWSRPRWPRAAPAVGVILVLLPQPWLATGLDWLHRRPSIVPREPLAALEELHRRLPSRVPALTNWAFPEMSETFAGYTNRWPIPEVAYYADRPLIRVTDPLDIEARKFACPAYVFDLSDSPGARWLYEYLSNRYEAVPVNRQYALFLLDRPKALPARQP